MRAVVNRTLTLAAAENGDLSAYSCAGRRAGNARSCRVPRCSAGAGKRAFQPQILVFRLPSNAEGALEIIGISPDPHSKVTAWLPTSLTTSGARTKAPMPGAASSPTLWVPQIARQLVHDVPVPPLDAASARAWASGPCASSGPVQPALDRRPARQPGEAPGDCRGHESGLPG